MTEPDALVLQKKRAANNAFLKEVVTGIPGWLYDFTATCVMELLDLQQESGWSGSLLEIGVYAGRFLSILARDAFRRNSRLLGIDPFLHFDIENVRERFRRLAPEGRVDANLVLAQDFSVNWTADRLLTSLGERARFIHIDGSHDRVDVLWDLHVSDGVLTPTGIIAVDDWLNPQCLGVMEATFQFFQHQPRMSVPFALVPGKLLLCGRANAANYKRRLEAFITEDRSFGQSEKFRLRSAMRNSGAVQPLLGSELMVLF
jgi:hypothetical protein